MDNFLFKVGQASRLPKFVYFASLSLGGAGGTPALHFILQQWRG
jgi:hypothetical protein